MINNKMRWATLTIITFLTALTLTLPIIAYYLTGNWLTLTPAAGTLPLGYVWIWMVKRVFPLNQQDHERELIRILSNKKEPAPKSTGSSQDDPHSNQSTDSP